MDSLLPFDVLAFIFNFLPDHALLRVISAVSKRWRNAALRVIVANAPRFYAEHDVVAKAMLILAGDADIHGPQKLPQDLQTLQIDNSGELYKCVCPPSYRTLTSLKHVSIFAARTCESCSCVLEMLRNNSSSIISLRIRNSAPDGGLDLVGELSAMKFPLLVHLNLAGSLPNAPKMLINYSKQLKSLEVLDPNLRLLDVLKKSAWPLLTRLVYLVPPTKVDPNYLRRIIDMCPSLVELEANAASTAEAIPARHVLTAVTLKWTPNLHDLEKLSRLRKASGVSSDFFEYPMATKMQCVVPSPPLLQLHRCPALTSYEYTLPEHCDPFVLPSLRHLTSLYFKSKFEHSDTVLMLSLSASMPNLPLLTHVKLFLFSSENVKQELVAFVKRYAGRPLHVLQLARRRDWDWGGADWSSTDLTPFMVSPWVHDGTFWTSYEINPIMPSPGTKWSPQIDWHSL